jgi:hypothetical protein
MIDLIRSFPSILELVGQNEAAVEQLVFVAWRRCLDGAMAENVLPVRLKGRRLIAAVPNETWRRQVVDLGPPLADKLNRMLGTEFVKYIEFQVDPSAAAARKNEAGQRRAVRPEPSPEIAAAAESIADDSLRAVFLAAAASSLARTRPADE